MEAFEFDRDTAVELVGDGRWAGAVAPGWSIGSAPNGGYLLAIALRAVAGALPHPDPVAASGYYLSRCQVGPVEVTVEPLRLGRAHSTATARLIQSGETRLHVTATYGDLDGARGPTAVTGDRPEFPPPDACVRAEGPPAPEFIGRFDLRLTPETAMWAIGHPIGVARMEGWIRFADGREPDTASLPLMADAFPPAILNVVATPWVPTFELTVHIRRRPAPGWLQARFQTRYLLDGYLEEDGEIWDSSGRLVALSRQLAQVQVPEERSGHSDAAIEEPARLRKVEGRG